jgi:hypothetical protein
MFVLRGFLPADPTMAAVAVPNKTNKKTPARAQREAALWSVCKQKAAAPAVVAPCAA